MGERWRGANDGSKRRRLRKTGPQVCEEGSAAFVTAVPGAEPAAAAAVVVVRPRRPQASMAATQLWAIGRCCGPCARFRFCSKIAICWGRFAIGKKYRQLCNHCLDYFLAVDRGRCIQIMLLPGKSWAQALPMCRCQYLAWKVWYTWRGFVGLVRLRRRIRDAWRANRFFPLRCSSPVLETAILSFLA